MFRAILLIITSLLLFYGITTVFSFGKDFTLEIWLVLAGLSLVSVVLLWAKVFPVLSEQELHEEPEQGKQATDSESIHQQALKVAETVRKQEYVDKLTQLGNRSFFDARLDVMLLPNRFSGEGALVLVSLTGLENALDEGAMDESQKDIVSQAAILIESGLQDFPDAIISRISTLDFAILLNPISKNQTTRIARKIEQALNRLQIPSELEGQNLFHIGVTRFTEGSSRFELMATADLALRSAQLKGASGWHEIDNDMDSLAWGMVQWRTFFENALKKKNIHLYMQPVVDLETRELVHNEVYARLFDRTGKEVFANEFVPMAAACGVLSIIDRLVIELLIKWYLKQPKSNQRLCINLSIDSLLDEAFVDWLIQRLSEQNNLLSKFIIEFPERSTLTPDGNILRTVKKLNEAGIEVGVDHVGEQLVELGYLEWFPASYLKIHQSIISSINDEQHQHQELLIQSLAKVADSKNFLLFAEGIESESQIQILDELGISAGQGFYLGTPNRISFN